MTRNDAPHSVGLLCTSDQLVTQISTWQHTTFTTDGHPCPPIGIRTHNLSRRAASELCLRPRGHWCWLITVAYYIHFRQGWHTQRNRLSVVCPTTFSHEVDKKFLKKNCSKPVITGLSVKWNVQSTQVYVNISDSLSLGYLYISFPIILQSVSKYKVCQRNTKYE